MHAARQEIFAGGSRVELEVSDEPGLGRVQFIGNYRILGILGQGAMGTVYDAVHAGTGRAVAIKTVSIANVRMLVALRAEIFALQQIDHPNVISILDDGVSDQQAWFAMQRLDGRSMRDFNRSLWGASDNTPVPSLTESGSIDGISSYSARLTVPTIHFPGSRPPAARGQVVKALQMYRMLCEALLEVHGCGVIHRDLKPSNVLVRRSETPVLSDFGLAWAGCGSDVFNTFAQRGRFVGSAPYVSPEQIRGQRVDARADLYALGCMLYETMTGRRPFSGATTREVLRKHVQELPIPQALLASGLPPALDVIITRLLAKSPRARVRDASEVLTALCKASDEARASDSSAAEDRGAAYFRAAHGPDVSRARGVAVISRRSERKSRLGGEPCAGRHFEHADT